MNEPVFVNLKDSRVIKAKYAKLFSKNFRLILNLSSILMLLTGIMLIVFKINLGWILLIPAALAVVINEWYRHELKDLLPKSTDTTPQSLMSAELLASLNSSNPSLPELIDSMHKHHGRTFFAHRFAYSKDIMSALQVGPDNSAWWNQAIQLWQQHPDEDGVGSAHVALALLQVASNKNEIYKFTNYREEDFIKGLDWYLQLKRIFKTVKKRKNSGGFARDWAAGYTPLLNRYAYNLSYDVQFGSIAHQEIVGHDTVIDHMVSIFSNSGRANCALVGEVGVGKNMCVQGLADKLIFGQVASEIKFNQIYQLDLASLKTSVKTDQLGVVISGICMEAYKAKNIILFFDNAGQFFGDDGGVDLTNVILPIVESGRVRMLMSFRPKNWQYMQRYKTAIAAALNYQIVKPANEQDTMHILENQTIFSEHQFKCLFDYASLKEIYRLADRYGPDIAMPARAISVMESAGRVGAGGLITKEVVQKSIEDTTGVKVGIASLDERSVLLNLEDQLHQRVVGQEVAVSEIASALKRSRSGVANPKKPIGTFLFLGPTGVGKTEVTKALAESYFGGEDRMVRVDMNEFITQDSVKRLLASGGKTSPTFLDAMRRQPFTVVLFDEIEKAHPDVVNVLLQLLDEGSLKDDEDHVISFKDAIIIATSNAGANFIRESIRSGKQPQALEDELINELIKSGTFKPEFVNRFDNVIVFAPLSKEQLRQVVFILLKGVNKELERQHIKVSLTEAAADWLAEHGYDALLGARPLRRLVQKTVETVISDRILQQQINPGDEITLDVADFQTIKI